jgi:hypothetical protein
MPPAIAAISRIEQREAATTYDFPNAISHATSCDMICAEFAPNVAIINRFVTPKKRAHELQDSFVL